MADPLPPLSSFAERLTYAREAASLSMRALANAAGLKSEGHVRIIEKNAGADPQGTTAKKLADALKVNLLWLISGEGEMRVADPEPRNGTEDR